MEVGVRLVGVVLRILNLLLGVVFWARGWWSGRRCVPPLKEPLLLRSAADLAAAIRDGELTSEHVVSAYIARVKEVNPYVNAVVEERYTAALEDARAVDRLLDEARRNNDLKSAVNDKPLLGVPFTVKESCSLAGLSNAVGCLENAGRRAAADGDAVWLVKAAGGIPLLVTNTPELCLGWETTNLLNGTTSNPYCLSRTAGGSSGGEGALLGSGASPFSVASDVAGSIRLPAAFCGVFGHKPTPGIISIVGHVPTLTDALFPKFLVVGPMARHAEDLPLLLGVMAGRNRDQLNLEQPVDFKKLQVHYVIEAGVSLALIKVHQSIGDAILKAAHYLERECGSKVYNAQETFSDLKDSVEMSISVFFSMKDVPNMLVDPMNPKVEKSLVYELIKSIFGSGTRSIQALGFTLINKTQLFIPKSRRSYYKSKAEQLCNYMTNILGENGVLLYPVCNGLANYHNQVFVRASGVLYTMLFNILGMPATVVPMGFYNGLPVGIQVVAAPNQDRLCISVAKQLEKGFGGWRPPLSTYFTDKYL